MMILTSMEIKQALAAEDVHIAPYLESAVNPNSYNFHLGDEILEALPSPDTESVTPGVQPLERNERGWFLLEPRHLYLGVTREVIGSHRYVTTLLGRSSLGRLGLFLNVTADLGHAGSASRWTLELTVVQPLGVYAGMPVGQVAFWAQSGSRCPYVGRYHGDLEPVPTRDPVLAAGPRTEGHHDPDRDDIGEHPRLLVVHMNTG